MRVILFLCAVAIAVAFATSTSRGDVESPADEPDENPEAEVMPNKGSETPMKDPFVPYDVGDPNGVWRYEDLNADEKVVAARGLEQDQAAVQDAYAEAARGATEQVLAQAAAIHLGLDGLAAIGGAP